MSVSTKLLRDAEPRQGVCYSWTPHASSVLSVTDRKAPILWLPVTHLLIKQTHAEVWNQNLMCPFIHFSDKSQ